MQQPTLTNIRIRSVEDAHIILYAAHRSLLSIITRRLDMDEKQALRAGDVYVWIEGNPQTDVLGLGIMRWTDGRKWSQSRTRDEFLYYEEEDPNGGAPPRPERMVKQTYSATVNTDDSRHRICLHTYYTDMSLRLLGTIDDIPELRGLQVPRGLFTRIKKSNRRSRDRSLYDSGEDKLALSKCARNFRLGPAIYDIPVTFRPRGSKDHAAAEVGSVTLGKIPGSDHLRHSIARSSTHFRASPTHAHLSSHLLEFSAHTSRYVVESTNTSNADHSPSHFISDAFSAQPTCSFGPMGPRVVQGSSGMTSLASATLSGWPTTRNVSDAVSGDISDSLLLIPFSQLRMDRAYPRDPIDDSHLRLLSNVASCV